MDNRGHRYTMPFLNCTVFTGAFLLFAMELMAGRILTPIFGGSIHVWLICTSFFQVMLLAGYLYNQLAGKTVGGWHVLLLILAMACLPLWISPAAGINDESIGKMLAILAARFALPFAALATTAVIMQVWLVRFRQHENPYSLYSASNAGSLLALISYPFLIEPFLGLRWQVITWSAGYGLYIVLATLSYFLVKPHPSEAGSLPAITSEKAHEPGPGWKLWVYWSILSSLTAALLLTVTHVMAAETGSFPLVWMLPLALYLVSFVITFRNGNSAVGPLAIVWPEIILAGVILYLVPSAHYIMLCGHFLLFFLVCLLVHSTLYNSRPDPHHLSSFFAALALGGAVGGMSVSLAAPMFFNRLLEYPILLSIMTVLFFRQYGYKTIFRGRSSPWFRVIRPVPIVLLASVAFLVGGDAAVGTVKYSHRNFYGISRVVDSPNLIGGSEAVRSLIHETTVHGMQLLDPGRRNLPTLYYHQASGLADIVAKVPSPARIAAIGLGVGTIAAYTRPGDILDFYEIDPDIERVARRWFFFLSDARAQVRVITGDGRISLSLNKTSTEHYDLIFLDTFSGGGIPAHLLTEEAIKIYLKRLNSHGVILFHLTNRHHDLRPIIRAAAKSLNLQGAVKHSLMALPESSKPVRTEYAVLTREPTDLQFFLSRQWKAFGDRDGLVRCCPWTDDYVNLLRPMAAGLDFASPLSFSVFYRDEQ